MPIVPYRLVKEPAMQHTTALSPQPAVTVTTSRCGAWLRRKWVELTLDVDERFLRGAQDLADLEWRLQRLERGRADRFGPLDPLA